MLLSMDTFVDMITNVTIHKLLSTFHTIDFPLQTKAVSHLIGSLIGLTT